MVGIAGVGWGGKSKKGGPEPTIKVKLSVASLTRTGTFPKNLTLGVNF